MTILRAGILLGVLVCASRARASEPLCFSTPAEAAAQSGTHLAGGFRLERVVPDRLETLAWALVRSCAHAEQPALLLPVELSAATAAGRRRAHSTGSAGRLAEAALLLSPETAVLQAGRRVTVVIHDEAARLETGAITLAAAAIGSRVRVRLDAAPGSFSEHFAEGVVRSLQLVEVSE